MDHSYMHEPHETKLSFWIMGNMLKGAGLALILLLVVGGLMALVWLFGQFLPEQSKQMPSPYSQIEAPLVVQVTDLV